VPLCHSCHSATILSEPTGSLVKGHLRDLNLVLSCELPPKERHALRIGPIVLGNNRFHNTNTVLHATNSGGNISSQSFWLIFGSAAFVHDLVSNRCLHFVQIHRLTTSPSLTNSDQSGAISLSPHLAHGVIMATSLALFLFSHLRNDYLHRGYLR
jgi:hypothetical protein